MKICIHYIILYTYSFFSCAAVLRWSLLSSLRCVFRRSKRNQIIFWEMFFSLIAHIPKKEKENVLSLDAWQYVVPTKYVSDKLNITWSIHIWKNSKSHALRKSRKPTSYFTTFIYSPQKSLYSYSFICIFELFVSANMLLGWLRNVHCARKQWKNNVNLTINVSKKNNKMLIW